MGRLSTGFTLADPNDHSMLDVVGYVRLVGRRQGEAKLADHIVSLHRPPACATRRPAGWKRST